MPLPQFVSQTIHHEAIDWATRASANGGTISTTTIRAVSDFCAAADRGAFRSAIYRLNPFAGGNLSGALVPLYRGPTFGGTNYGSATDTAGNFVSADYSDNGGLKGNGTNKYLLTGFRLTNLPQATSVHLSCSATEASASGTACFLGTYNFSETTRYQLNERSGSVRNFNSGGAAPSVSLSDTEPHIIGSRTDANAAAVYRSGSIAATNTTNVSLTLATVPIIVFSLGLNPEQPAAGNYSAARMRMYSIGSGLSAAQAAAFSSAVIAFNAALAR
jgi:hypothetical protein